MVPNAKFHPLVRNKVWDGRIRLFNIMTKQIYAGLLEDIEQFCKSRNYEIEYLFDFDDRSFSVKEAEEFIKTIELPFKPYDYQIDALVQSVRKNRGIILSSTGSGKSLMIYLLTEFYNVDTLVICPTVSLVHQLSSDFSDYGFDSDQFVHRIMSGQEKITDKPITISTWQSLTKMPKEYFKKFKLVIVDEVHGAKAKEMTSIMEKMTHCKFRFGFTGTLDDIPTNEMTLKGLFGSIRRVSSTKDLMEQKKLADLKIKCLTLKYSAEVRKAQKDLDYQQEMDFLVRNESRNRFIKNLALSLKRNTLVLFQYVDKHGKELYQKLQDENQDRNIYFIHGGVDGEDREVIRKVLETEQNAILVASMGTFSTGVNVKNIHNIIFASPSKAKIRTLQSIGRGLRTMEGKEFMTLFDIADDLSWKSHKNYTLEHFKERLKIYINEGFDYKIYNIDMGD